MVDVKRIGDEILALKLVVAHEIINIISAYTPQVGLEALVKEKSWEDMEGLVQGVP